MPSEIIVEFPSPLTDKEKKMIYGYKGEVVRCKGCRSSTVTELRELYCYRLEDIVGAEDYCSKGERRKDEQLER